MIIAPLSEFERKSDGSKIVWRNEDAVRDRTFSIATHYGLQYFTNANTGQKQENLFCAMKARVELLEMSLCLLLGIEAAALEDSLWGSDFLRLSKIETPIISEPVLRQ